MKRSRTHSSKYAFFFVCLAVLLFAPYCNKKEDNNVAPVKYKKLALNTDNARHLSTSTENLRLYDAIRIDDTVFGINKGIWMIDLKTGKEELLFRHGVGPNEIYHAGDIVRFDNQLYINSAMPSKYLFHFNVDESLNKQLKNLSFNERDAFSFDDFLFISDNVLAFAFTDWNDGLVKFYDLEKKEYVKCFATPTRIPLMSKFNINTAALCLHDGRLYVAESIKPEVKVISLKTGKITDVLKLSPPFYAPLSAVKEAAVEKFRPETIKKWMAKWTVLVDLFASDHWLLLKYQWGWDKRFCYELVNLQKLHQRYYIDEIPYEIFDMQITGNRAVFTASEEREEELAWLELDVVLQ